MSTTTSLKSPTGGFTISPMPLSPLPLLITNGHSLLLLHTLMLTFQSNELPFWLHIILPCPSLIPHTHPHYASLCFGDPLCNLITYYLNNHLSLVGGSACLAGSPFKVVTWPSTLGLVTLIHLLQMIDPINVAYIIVISQCCIGMGLTS